MRRARSTAAAVVMALLATPAALAQDPVRYYEENGIKYQETTQVTQRPITETRWVPHETTVQTPKLTTTMQPSVRTYQVPVTEHQWVPGWQRTWNVFAPPVLTYRLMPVTRWETRTETVQVPITKQEYVEQRHVQHVPITNTKIANETVVRRVAIGAANSGATANVAQRNDFGGTSLNSDPPRDAGYDQPVDRRR